MSWVHLLYIYYPESISTGVIPPILKYFLYSFCFGYTHRSSSHCPCRQLLTRTKTVNKENMGQTSAPERDIGFASAI